MLVKLLHIVTGVAMMNQTTSTVIANTTYSNTTEKSVNIVINEITKPSEEPAQSSPPTTNTDQGFIQDFSQGGSKRGITGYWGGNVV